MGRTQVGSKQVGDGSIGRDDLNTVEAGQAVIRKVIAGRSIVLSSSGADAGTGDVTINVGAVLEWEMGLLLSSAQYKRVLNYTGSQLTSIQIYSDAAGTQLAYTKTFNYTGQQLDSIVITRASDSATFTKTLNYSGSSLINIVGS